MLVKVIVIARDDRPRGCFGQLIQLGPSAQHSPAVPPVQRLGDHLYLQVPRLVSLSPVNSGANTMGIERRETSA
eukprot:m.48610 g.48610  ORF g.48610 m.48610 type:complete len:74 (-) comp8923_c0_seq1:2103-2324(-)